jgi:hypothetical protein
LILTGLVVGPGGERVRDRAGEDALSSSCAGLWDVFWTFLGLFVSSSEASESDEPESEEDSEEDLTH